MIRVEAPLRKIIPFILLLFCFWACAGENSKEKGDKFSDLSIHMDTVMVDPKDEILMAATNGYGHAISKDVTRLYNWDSKSSKVEIVDLDDLILVEKIPIEKEGPDGVGQNAYVMRYVGEDMLAFIGWDDRITLTDLRGKVMQKIKLDEPWMVEDLEERTSLSFLGFSENGEKVYCSISNFQKLDPKIFVFDLKSQEKLSIDLSEFEKRDKYRVMWKSDDGMSMSMTYPGLNLVNWHGKVLFYTTSLNSIYQYDPEKDTLSLHRYENALTASEKTGTYQNEVSTQEEMQKISTQISEEVNFTKVLWDEKNGVFYRFTWFTLPKIGDEKIKYKNFISVLNTNFELIGEKEITDFGFNLPSPQFVKDGKIYLFLNLDDELAYIRMSVN